ncbi:hypothetical protein F0562_005360 [Nyssa sinensis]|uniref:Armadillo repeat-containing domain-containing protein n=1 Tax=Nyssa sinensis TaxID=561372 RepID=A0A5J5AM30_9ASTE|nr:hypothetical protein F0562_005360 [Nyssa sinensis]
MKGWILIYEEGTKFWGEVDGNESNTSDDDEQPPRGVNLDAVSARWDVPMIESVQEKDEQLMVPEEVDNAMEMILEECVESFLGKRKASEISKTERRDVPFDKFFKESTSLRKRALTKKTKSVSLRPLKKENTGGRLLSLVYMFTNSQRQEERTGRHGTPRVQFLQELVTQFQNTTNEESKERIVANLANFAYDPYDYTFLRQLNVLELFLDCITEPNEKLVEFGVGGICNACVDPANAAIVTECGGVPLITQCLSSPVRNTVNYALGALYYICNKSSKEEIVRPEVTDAIERFAAAGAVGVSFCNLAQSFLDKHVSEDK